MRPSPNPNIVAKRQKVKNAAPFNRSLFRQRRARHTASDALTREAGERLTEDLELIRRDFSDILDLGGQTPHLAEAYPKARLITQDAARQADVKAEEDALPFAAASFDLIVSNMTLHAVNDLPGALLQIRQCLRPDGLFSATLLGGESLIELRQSFLEAELDITGGAASRLIPLPEFQSCAALLQRAGFALPVAHREMLRVEFENFWELLRAVRGAGFANFAHDRAKKPLRRETLSRAAEIYAQKFGASGKIFASAEIVYLSGWSPADTQQKPLPRGSGQIDLAKALR